MRKPDLFQQACLNESVQRIINGRQTDLGKIFVRPTFDLLGSGMPPFAKNILADSDPLGRGLNPDLMELLLNLRRTEFEFLMG